MDSLLLVLLLLSPADKKVEYFPPLIFSSDPRLNEFRAKWYSGQFAALEEPSLWELSKTTKREAYRFVWLRTFHHPIGIRIEVQEDGTGILTIKETSGAGGYEPGELITNQSRVISKEQTRWFLERVEILNYWNLPLDGGATGCDGASWIIEGVRDGQYKIVDYWSPRKGPVRTLGLAMVTGLAGLKIPRDEIY